MTALDPVRWHPAFFRGLGLEPRTLIDVGVANGTPALYDAFPGAYLVLVEPLSEFDRELNALLAHRSGIHHPVLLGERVGETTMHVDPVFPERSSQHRRVGPERVQRSVERRSARCTTLDVLLSEHPAPPPYGVKLDVEGPNWRRSAARRARSRPRNS